MPADVGMVQALLEEFKGIPRDAWWHGDDNLSLKAGDKLPSCGFCVGQVAAYALGLISEGTYPYGKYVNYSIGRAAMANAFDMDYDDLGRSLYKYGAPENAFGIIRWRKDPYEVLCKLAIEHGIDISA